MCIVRLEQDVRCGDTCMPYLCSIPYFAMIDVNIGHKRHGILDNKQALPCATGGMLSRKSHTHKALDAFLVQVRVKTPSIPVIYNAHQDHEGQSDQ